MNEERRQRLRSLLMKHPAFASNDALRQAAEGIADFRPWLWSIPEGTSLGSRVNLVMAEFARLSHADGRSVLDILLAGLGITEESSPEGAPQ